MKTTLLTLSLLPLALAQQNNGVGCDGISDAVANYACGLSAEGFNGAAATYLAQQLTASGIEDAFDAANSAAGSAAAFPTDASGQVNPLAIISALQPGATGVVSSILQQVASLQGGSAAPAATGASGSGSGSAKATGSGSSTGAAVTSAAKSSGSGSGAASGTGAMTTGMGGAASSSGAGVGAAGANATMSTHNAAAKPTMALGAVAGVLVGVAGLAAAL